MIKEKNMTIPKKELSVQEKVLDHIQAITFLQNTQELKKYLEDKCSEEQEHKILKLRINLLWFHCALLKLENLDYLAEEYSKEIQEEAREYLEEYYYANQAQEMHRDINQEKTPSISQEIQTKNSNIKENNKGIIDWLDDFYQKIKQTPELRLSMTRAADTYCFGTPYQKYSISIPISNKDNIQNAEIAIEITVKFNFIPQTSFQKQTFYGVLELSNQANLTMEQKKRFFSMWSINLSIRKPNQEQEQIVLQDIRCNLLGVFNIEKDWQIIYDAVKAYKLTCTLKLI